MTRALAAVAKNIKSVAVKTFNNCEKKIKSEIFFSVCNIRNIISIIIPEI